MQIQTTNDSSIVSKLSSAKKGFYDDAYLEVFVEREQKRSPIINRGYYIRFKAMENIFESWFSLISSAAFSNGYQIISLGAGFDSSYFRLKGLNKLSMCKYIEIDFPEVMKRKLNCLREATATINIDFSAKHISDPAIVASTGDYTMLGIDLKNREELEHCFALIGIDYSLPTLILSECVITYMDVENSNRLIKWFQENFFNSAFVAYEQINPYDGFGIIMQNHFNSISCPLKSLLLYHNEEKQYHRYMDMGWTYCHVMEMYSFFMSLPDHERIRIQALELFDEFEVWHEKCHHYVLVCASQGEVSLSYGFKLKGINLNQEFNLETKRVKWKFNKADKLLHRFGHQVLPISSTLALISGGFGEINKRHQRLDGLTLYDFVSEKCFLASVLDIKDKLSKRMFHTMTRLSNDHIVLIGGRSAPNKVFEDLIVLRCIDKEHEKTLSVTNDRNSPERTFSVSICGNGLPVSTWRHSANLVTIEGMDLIVIFGGRTIDQLATNQCYILNTNNWSWSEVSFQQHTPSPRHSHSSVTYKDSKILIIGGLSADETILNSCHVLDCQTSDWSTLQVPGLLPRYAHTSHILGDKIYLIGGVTSISGCSLGVGIIDLTTMQAIEFTAPAQDPEYPILLCNHSSFIHDGHIVIIGGGGNCFSFGTLFNRLIVFIDIKQFL